MIKPPLCKPKKCPLCNKELEEKFTYSIRRTIIVCLECWADLTDDQMDAIEIL